MASHPAPQRLTGRAAASPSLLTHLIAVHGDAHASSSLLTHLVAVHGDAHAAAAGGDGGVGAGRLAQRGQVLLQALHVLHGCAVLHIAPVGQAMHAQALGPALGRLPQSRLLSALMLE